MTADILNLAKQGNPKAIAALMNRHLKPQGITARVSLKDDCLRVVLESEQLPDEHMMTAFIQKGLTALNSPAIARVKIFGQQIGDDIPAWSRDLELTGKLEVATPVHRAQPVEDAVSCPKCGSTQIMAAKKGFGVGKAAIGTILLGPVGLVGGMMGSNQLMISCMKCGHQWEPGEKAASEGKEVVAEKQITHRVTKALVKTMSVEERTSLAVCTFVVCFLSGILLFFLPVFGWLIGLALLALSVYIPYKFIAGDREFISRLVGNCPHCGKEADISNINAQQFKCSHCKQEVFIRGQEFHTIRSHL